MRSLIMAGLALALAWLLTGMLAGRATPAAAGHTTPPSDGAVTGLLTDTPGPPTETPGSPTDTPTMVPTRPGDTASPTGTASPTVTWPPGGTATPTASFTPAPTVAPGCGPAWSSVPLPGATPLGVSVAAAGDVWVGGAGRVGHWDGSTWQAVAIPTSVTEVRFSRESAAAPDDVWGLSNDGLVHWDGTTWSTLATPTATPGPFYGGDYTFKALAANSADDVWIVGAYSTNLSEINPYVAAHWDGSTWHVIEGPTSPAPDGAAPGGAANHAASLVDVTIVGPGTAWAVGYDHWSSPSPSFSHPLLLELSDAGAAPGPDLTPDPQDRYLGIAAESPQDIWWVGYGTSGPLAYHYDGTSTTAVPVPAGTGNLASVVAPAPDDVWAAGDHFAHWDGAHWTVLPSPGVGQLAAGDRYDVWAAGVTGIYHWPDLPIFTDVQSYDPFYAYVQTLACRGDIAGYDCGGPGEPCDGAHRPYFRTYNTVTRGQTAKIVAIAAGLSATPAGQTFTDVPPSQPFYTWIEEMAAAGIISGYTCGGPGEPCDDHNRPYFRPYVDVTRGQMSKIVALASGLSGTPSGQTFADVPPGQPFYTWVEQIAAAGIISGYTCGGPGEPCDAEHRPYFRPGATATRGQTAKIVANTFFPGGGPLAPKP